MSELTVILLTANKVPEQWAKYHLEVLKNAAKGHEWMVLSKDPVDFGLNDHAVSSEGLENIYLKVLRGAKLAKTEYIATVEDDTLYHQDHFAHRPKQVGYDLNRWALFTWGEPFYYHKPKMTNAGMIAKRDLVIECIEKRYKDYPKGLPRRAIYEVGRVPGEPEPEIFYSRYGFVGLAHRFAIDELEQRHHKKPGPVQAYDVPFWGRAEDLRKKFE